MWAMNILAGMLPIGVGPRTRALVYRLFGISIGPGTTLFGPIKFVWYGEIARNVSIGRACFISRDIVMDPTDAICIGDRVYLGPEVSFITATHEIAAPSQRAGAMVAAPIRVGDGVWIGSRATILPGVCIGNGAVVGAAALVTRDVPANTVVGGVPARTLRTLDETNSAHFDGIGASGLLRASATAPETPSTWPVAQADA